MLRSQGEWSLDSRYAFFNVKPPPAPNEEGGKYYAEVLRGGGHAGVNPIAGLIGSTAWRSLAEVVAQVEDSDAPFVVSRCGLSWRCYRR